FQQADRLGQRLPRYGLCRTPRASRMPRVGCRGVRAERRAERGRGADLARQRELLRRERGRLLRASQRGLRGGRGGAPGRDGGIVNAESAPALARREQVVQGLGVAALRDPQTAPCLQEGSRVDPAGGWLTAGGGRGDGGGIVEAAEAGERL